MSPTLQCDVVVVGAGLAGLTAAAHLARAGRNVVLLERNSQLGGRARTDNLDGWLFNQGAHALYRNGIGHQTLQGLGIEPDGVLAPLKGSQLAIAGAATPLPGGPIGLATTKAMSARSKVQFARFMTALPKLDASAHASITVDDWLAPLRPDVQETIKAIVRLATYSADTNIMSADAAIAQIVAGQEGVLYLNHGWAALCAQIAAVATNHGATIIPGSSVTSIATHNGLHTVTTESQSLSAPAIIVAAGGPELTASLLDINADELGPVGPPCQAAVLDLALGEMPAHHRFVLSVDEPTYFSIHSPPASMAPPGKVAAVAMRYLTQDDEGSADEHRASLERVAELAGTHAAVRTRFLRRMTVTNAMPTAATGGMPGRPAAQVAGSTGIFIAGDWVGARGLLADAAIASGFDAAAAIERTVQPSRSATLA